MQWILNNILRMRDGFSFSEVKNCDVIQFIDEVLHQDLERK